MEIEAAQAQQVSGIAGNIPDTADNGGCLIQASFRLPMETCESVRQMAARKKLSQSEIMRAASALYRQCANLPPNLKLAIVDVNDHEGPDYYRVSSWLLIE